MKMKKKDNTTIDDSKLDEKNHKITNNKSNIHWKNNCFMIKTVKI